MITIVKLAETEASFTPFKAFHRFALTSYFSLLFYFLVRDVSVHFDQAQLLWGV